MHQLHLLRHTKSSWDDDADDHGRPLNKRGREAARLIGDSLPQAVDALDLVLCSSALRARETAELVLAKFSPVPKVRYEDGLYLADAEDLMQRLRQLDEAAGSVISLVGHNPGMHELAVTLAAPGSAGVQHARQWQISDRRALPFRDRHALGRDRQRTPPADRLRHGEVAGRRST